MVYECMYLCYFLLCYVVFCVIQAHNAARANLAMTASSAPISLDVATPPRSPKNRPLLERGTAALVGARQRRYLLAAEELLR